MEFGDILKQIRRERGLSQDELAALLGTTKQVLSRYETKKRVPRLSVVADYAQKLGIPLSLFAVPLSALFASVPSTGKLANDLNVFGMRGGVFLAVMRMMFELGKHGKIRDFVVCRVMVYMVDVVSFRDGTVEVFPHDPVEPSPVVLEILAAEVEAFTVKLLLRVVDNDHLHVHSSSEGTTLIRSSPGLISSSRFQVPSDSMKRWFAVAFTLRPSSSVIKNTGAFSCVLRQS
jgi:transcriptional regulator with XRE-family HTH domain